MKAPLWYSFLGGRAADEGIEFYDPGKFNWVSNIINNYDAIRSEISDVVKRRKQEMPVYFNKSLVEKGTKWKTYSMMFWNIPFKKQIRECAKTYSIIKDIPGIVSCSVSMLEAGSRIKPHRGDTNAIIRCHIPITIPGTLPENGFRVGTTTKEWREGELLLFNDAEEHEAWNLSGSDRVILIIDVIRPEYLDQKTKICANVLSGLLLQLISSPKPLRFTYRNRKIRLALQKLSYSAVRGILPVLKALR